MNHESGAAVCRRCNGLIGACDPRDRTLCLDCAALFFPSPTPPPDPISPKRPTIVCLCGSTRFWREFQAASLRETLAGRIVLSIGAASGTDDEHFGNLPKAEYDAVKTRLDNLHLRKIDLADEVLILNLGGYIGESTGRELAYAKEHGKVIRFLEPPIALTPKPPRCIDCGAEVETYLWSDGFVTAACGTVEFHTRSRAYDTPEAALVAYAKLADAVKAHEEKKK